MSVLEGFFIVSLVILSISSLATLLFVRNLYVVTQTSINSLTSFVAPRGEEPSNLAVLWDSMVDRVMGKVTMGQLGTKSGDARREKSAEVDYIKGVVSSENPMIAMALDQFFPKWGKMIQNNPQIMPQMLEFMNKKAGSTAPANGTQIKFPL